MPATSPPSLLSPVLIGRDAEVQQLDALDEVVAGADPPAPALDRCGDHQLLGSA